MSEELFSVVLTGDYRDLDDPERAVAGFAKAFKCGEDKARAALGRAPVTIKKGLSRGKADKYLQLFGKLGLAVELRSLDGVPAKAPEAKARGHAAQSPEQTPKVSQPESFRGYTFRIEGRPDYSFITVKVPANETLRVEASAMATMDTNMQMKTKLRGGFGRFLTGESLFINDFIAEGGPAEIGIAPAAPGDTVHRYLDNETIFLQNGAYVANSQGVEVETKWQGMAKGFFSGEGLFLIRAHGRGDLWFNSYGGMIELDVDGDYVVDTGNIVAFTEGLDYTISKPGGYKSLFFSGEGFVCRFSGRGKVWIQTRSMGAFAGWVHPYRPVKKRG